MAERRLLWQVTLDIFLVKNALKRVEFQVFLKVQSKINCFAKIIMDFAEVGTNLICYGWLVDHFLLNVCELLEVSYHTGCTQRMGKTDGFQCKTYYPKSRYPLADIWSGHLRFAIRYEGVQFEVLKAFLRVVDETKLQLPL